MAVSTDLRQEHLQLQEMALAQLPRKPLEAADDGRGEVVVSVKNVSKKFCKNLKRSMAYGIVDLAKNLAGIKPDSTTLRKDEFWALDDISFELRRGEAVGLIGVNGSGKTTLLRLIAGLFPPDRGEIMVKGRVGALIAVGAGFHGFMTGRENIYLNGSILGMRQEQIVARFQDIVDFAEIGDFLDAPVSTYSSGMRVRLGFSIATAIDPDVLLIDEILAVGDRQFQVKCFNRIGNLAQNCAVVFVSHSMERVARVTTSVILLNQGQIVFNGETMKGIRLYNSLYSSLQESFVRTSRGFHFEGLQLANHNITWDDELCFQVQFSCDRVISDCKVRVLILDDASVVVAEWRGESHGKIFNVVRGENVVTECIPQLRLRDGRYYLSFVLNSLDGIEYLIGAHACASFDVKNGIYGNVSYQL